MASSASNVAIIGGVALSVLTLAMCDGKKTAAPSGPPDYAAAARHACAEFIERLARDPTSFASIDQWSWRTNENNDGTWSVLAHYRAKNGFGGLNVEKTTCVMRRSGDDWKLITAARM